MYSRLTEVLNRLTGVLYELSVTCIKCHEVSPYCLTTSTKCRIVTPVDLHFVFFLNDIHFYSYLALFLHSE